MKLEFPRQIFEKKSQISSFINIKVKVKFTKEQTIEGSEGSRVIALLFL
jgi:hypothetical protein